MAPFRIQIAVYDVLDIRAISTIRQRLETQYSNPEIEALYTRQAKKVVEKCKFDTIYLSVL